MAVVSAAIESKASFESLWREATERCEPPTWVIWDGVMYALEEMICGCGFEYHRHSPAERPPDAKPGQTVRLCNGTVVVLRERSG